MYFNHYWLVYALFLWFDYGISNIPVDVGADIIYGLYYDVTIGRRCSNDVHPGYNHFDISHYKRDNLYTSSKIRKQKVNGHSIYNNRSYYNYFSNITTYNFSCGINRLYSLHWILSDVNWCHYQNHLRHTRPQANLKNLIY
ncbi:MAG: hypothetical protein ACFFBT_12075 [Promethearchaeota archaeon]